MYNNFVLFFKKRTMPDGFFTKNHFVYILKGRGNLDPIIHGRGRGDAVIADK